MFTYLIGVTSVIVVWSTLLVYILIKYNMINLNSVVAIGASTIAGGLFYPVIKTVFIKLSEFLSVAAGIILSAGIFLALIFCISSIITSLIMNRDLGKIIKDFLLIFIRKQDIFHPRFNEQIKHNNLLDKFKVSFAGTGNINYSGNVLIPDHPNSSKRSDKTPDTEKISKEVEVNSLKLIDGSKSDGACSLECLEQCIDKAFDFRENGTASDALLCYLRALELQPEKELASWIVVEICSIYKELGRYDKIREFAENFNISEEYDSYSNLFYEIHKSLH